MPYSPGMESRWRRRSTKGLLAAWFATLVGMSGLLLGRHLLALPRPATTDIVMRRALNGLVDDAHRGKTPVLHVLSTECRCSERVAAHLTGTTRPADVVETVLLVGEDPALERRLVSRGLAVRHATAESLATEWHIQAVPLLVVGSPAGEIHYVGGYTTTKQAYEIHDLQLILAARHGRPDPLPIVGCAVAEGLKRKLDPTGALP